MSSGKNNLDTKMPRDRCVERFTDVVLRVRLNEIHRQLINLEEEAAKANRGTRVDIRVRVPLRRVSVDPLTPVQQQILALPSISPKVYAIRLRMRRNAGSKVRNVG